MPQRNRPANWVEAFVISAHTDHGDAQQSFNITAAQMVVETAAQVDPADPNGATVTVDAPLSSVQGAAVQLDPGSLPPGAPVDVTISSMQNAPVPPSAGMAGVANADLRPVELGPTGLAFRHPARLQLPVPAAVLAHGNPIVQTYDYASGKWQKKIRGVIHYLSAWFTRVEGMPMRTEGDGCEVALAEYKKVAADLYSGRTPQPDASGLTVGDLCDHFLTAKLLQVEARELTPDVYRVQADDRHVREAVREEYLRK